MASIIYQYNFSLQKTLFKFTQKIFGIWFRVTGLHPTYYTPCHFSGSYWTTNYSIAFICPAWTTRIGENNKPSRGAGPRVPGYTNGTLPFSRVYMYTRALAIKIDYLIILLPLFSLFSLAPSALEFVLEHAYLLCGDTLRCVLRFWKSQIKGRGRDPRVPLTTTLVPEPRFASGAPEAIISLLLYGSASLTTDAPLQSDLILRRSYIVILLLIRSYRMHPVTLAVSVDWTEAWRVH